MGRTVGVPQEATKVGGSAVVPQEPRGAEHPANVPQELPGVSLSTQEQGVGSKRPRSDEAEQGSGGSSPKRIYCPTTLM